MEPKVGVVEFIKEHLDYRAKLALGAICIVALVLLWNHMRDLEKQREQDAKVIATLQQEYQKVGSSAIAGNQVAVQKDINKQAAAVVDPAVLELMRQQGAVISELTRAVGEIKSQVTVLSVQPKEFGGKQDASGALHSYVLEENRRNLPATSAVSLSYDPKQQDPNQAFLGTTWQHYDEKFDVTVGQWEKKKDGGYKTSLSLSRTVSKPDPADPQKLVVVGKEMIPITGADTVYGPKGLETKTFRVPRWTATLGVSKQSSRYEPAALLDYRISDKFGISAGVINKTPVAGVSVRFGKP